LVHLATVRRIFPWPALRDLLRRPQRPIAILVPLWHEDRVIAEMIDRNLSAIRYRNYHVFVGVHPNDTATVRAVVAAARRHRRAHMAVCPHDGPTSKGDCLNWTYRRMREDEARHHVRFRILMTHDAEDVIHPDSLHTINWFSREYAMVQIPVLPLATPPREWTHGLYCDEFAEYQTKDIPVRQRLGGFLPANGVGTGFAREAIEHLAAARGGAPFDPSCLTEDYETGFEIHAMGYRQVFVPLRGEGPELCATREYFPRVPKASIRQRCRWVTGIALQGWQRPGWDVPSRQLYWFWRDRKGLVGNLLTPVDNLLLIYTIARCSHMAATVPAWIAATCQITFFIAAIQMGMRVQSAAAIYGWRFAAGVPARIVWGNLVNFSATWRALAVYGWRGGRASASPGRRPSTLIRSTRDPTQRAIQFLIRPFRDSDRPVEAPALDMSHGLAGLENRHRPEGFQLQEIRVGEGLEGAAVVGISRRFGSCFVLLDE
jgi:adsorption protein B